MATILIVDDRPTNRQFLETLLGYEGHQLRFAADGLEALAAAQTEPLDLIITDILMPRMDGYELMRHLRADPALATIPVIFYTATYLERDAVVLAKKCGVTHLLTKPMDPEVILKTIRDVLAVAPARLDQTTPYPLPPEVDDEHRRLLNESLYKKVEWLEVEIAHRRHTESALRDREERLHILSRRLLNAQETERGRIARELHEVVSPTLTALKTQLQGLLQPAAGGLPPTGPQECIAIVERLLQQVRTLSMDLRPSMLDDQGLVAALRSHVARQSRLANFTARYQATELKPRPCSELEIACFRVAQESLTNIMRHSGATTVWIDLRQINDRLHLVLRDDGSGFDMTSAEHRARLGECVGVLGMQERVTLLGGRLRIRSTPGRGTTVHASFPLLRSGDPPAVARPTLLALSAT